MSSNPAPYLIAIGLGLALLVGGLMLLKRGRWPRRSGSEPHCPKCDYLLIGIDSDRCPECGASLNPGSIVLGHRTRRTGLTWAGAVMLLLGSLVLLDSAFEIVTEINWYRFEPAFMLVTQVRSAGPSSFLALTELLRRDQAGSLSASAARDLVDVALQQQGATTPISEPSELLGFAQHQYDLGKLTDPKKQLLMKQSIRLTLRIRPRVALGDDVPYEVSEAMRIVDPWSIHVQSAGVSIDGKHINGPETGYGEVSGIGSGGSFGTSVPCRTPGVHRIEVVVHIEVRRPYEIFSGPPGAEKQTLYSEDRILSGTFEVVAKPPSDLLTAIDDATLTPQIEACLTPLEFTFGRNIKNRLAGQIQIRNAPVNLSLRLFARYNDRDHPMSAITCAAGKGSNYYVVGDNIKDPPPAKIDLILRTDEQAARQTIDQTNVWKGEIVIKDVEVKPATK